MVAPPKVLVNYPPVITIQSPDKFMNQFGSVQDIQIEKHGMATCKFVFLESAYVSVGVNSPFGQYGIVSVPSGSPMDDKAYNSKLDNYHTHTADFDSRKAYGSKFLKLTPPSLEAALAASSSTTPASMNTDHPLSPTGNLDPPTDSMNVDSNPTSPHARSLPSSPQSPQSQPSKTIKTK